LSRDVAASSTVEKVVDSCWCSARNYPPLFRGVAVTL
jgi:hypothetical protein